MSGCSVQNLQKLQSIQPVSGTEVRWINISLIVGRTLTVLSAIVRIPSICSKSGQNLTSPLCLLPSVQPQCFYQKVVWQKLAWNLGCLRSTCFPWGSLMDKEVQSQQNLTALQLPALQVWMHITYSWINTLLKLRLSQQSCQCFNETQYLNEYSLRWRMEKLIAVLYDKSHFQGSLH